MQAGEHASPIHGGRTIRKIFDCPLWEVIIFLSNGECGRHPFYQMRTLTLKKMMQ